MEQVARVALAMLAVAACGGGFSKFEYRAGKHRTTWNQLSRAQRAQVRRGSYSAGMPAGAAVIARDEPAFTWDVPYEGKTCRGRLFASDPQPEVMDVADVVCDGKIVLVENLAPPIVGRQVMVARAEVINRDPDHFAALELDKQLRLIRGVSHVGDLAQEFDIAFVYWQFMWRAKVDGEPCVIVLDQTDLNGPIDRASYVCNGRVKKFENLDTAIPLAGFAARAQRIIANQQQFTSLPWATQWDVLRGTIRQGQDEATLVMAWGPPYQTNANNGQVAHTFVDGDYFGATVTVRDNRITGWQYPAQKVLTPEAQARIDAERRAAQAELARLEQERLAAEEQARLAQQQRVAQMRAQWREQQQQQQQPQRRVIRSNTSRSSASRTLTINGRTYTGGEHLGRSCSLQSPCPSGYACTMVTSSMGQCTQ